MRKALRYSIGLIPYLVQLLFSKQWYFQLKAYFQYSTLNKEELFSVYNLKGILVFLFPFLLNELAVYVVILFFFKSKHIFKQYFTVSFVFWFVTICLRVIAQGFDIQFLERFTSGFFYLGTSPLWLLVWLFFFFIQQNRLKKVA